MMSLLPLWAFLWASRIEKYLNLCSEDYGLERNESE